MSKYYFLTSLIFLLSSCTSTPQVDDGLQIRIVEEELKIEIYDIRDIQKSMLDGVDAVVHLAGVSNDPIGNEFEKVTEDINQHASVKLAKMASNMGVKNFVFFEFISLKM